MASYDSKFESISSQLESVLASAGVKSQPETLPEAVATTSWEVTFSAEPPMEAEYEEYGVEVASSSAIAQHSVVASAPPDQVVRWQDAVLVTQTLCEFEFPQDFHLSDPSM